MVNREELDRRYGSIEEISALIKANLASLKMEDYASFELGEEELEKLSFFAQLLLSTNEKMNLTGATDAESLVKRHIIDSLALHRVLLSSEHTKVLDVGTGAGFPGLPLSIVSEARFSLLDSLHKRMAFLEGIRGELGLLNVELVCERAEDYIRKSGKRGWYDIVTSRAVAPLRLLLELCLPYLKKDGYFYAFKGKNYEEELLEARNAMGQLHAELAEVIPYELGKDQTFYILKFRLLKLPAETYPRRAGIPAKRPL